MAKQSQIENNLQLLLQDPDNGNSMSLSDLEDVIGHLNRAYNNGQSLISDDHYDIIAAILEKRKPNVALYRLGTDNKGKNKLYGPHCPSADKVRSQNEIDRFIKRQKKEKYILQHKLDGISGQLSSTTFRTRGDGACGTNITQWREYIIGINNIPDGYYVGGELIISKKTFKRYFSKKFVSARATVSGMVGREKLGEDDINLLQHVQFLAFELIPPEGEDSLSPSEQMKQLKKMGFTSPKWWKTSIDDLTYEYLADIFEKERQKAEFDIDGIMIITDAPYSRITDGNPTTSAAFKTLLKDQIATTTVIEVVYSFSRHGVPVPTVIFEPVQLGGFTIQRATGHNVDFIVDKGIGPGAVIEIVRSGDVIPYINNVIQPVKPTLPPNKDVSADAETTVKKIEFFLRTIGVERLGVKSIKKLGELTLGQVLELNEDQWISALGAKAGPDAMKRIATAISKIPLLEAMVGSGCFPSGIGHRVLLKANIAENMELSDDNLKTTLLEIDGIKEKIAIKIVEGVKCFKKWRNEHPMINIVNPTISNNKKKVTSKGKLHGQVFVFSGFRDAKLQKRIEEHGGVVNNSVSKTTTILIIKDRNQKPTKKVHDAEILQEKGYKIKIKYLDDLDL
tara:strand:- start:25 stop:1890 length:1866 start_codon:yes stop_codon:yes gene_type:complete